MRAAIFNEPGSVTASVRPDAVIVEPTDAIVRVVLACVCGSDHRGESPFEPGPIGIKPGRVLDYEIGVDRGVFTTLLEEVPGDRRSPRHGARA